VLRRAPRRERVRFALSFAATAVVLGPLVWFWQASLVPGTYSVTDHGRVDHGGGPAGDSTAHAGHRAPGAAARDVTSLTADPNRPADVAVTLTARKERVRSPSGRLVDRYTVNGRSPGPTIRATVGQLVQVRLVNESVPGGTTLHWHGVDVPNAADGVAGVTQDAVGPGEEYTYRFVVGRAGTFWYHSHQQSHAQVAQGLLGAVVVMPPRPVADVDVVALAHLYEGVHTVNGRAGDLRVAAAPGARARVRVVNTENGHLSAWVAGAPFRVVAVDGTDLSGPTPLEGVAVRVAAGGRADLEVVMPRDGSPVRVHVGGPDAVVLGSGPPDTGAGASVAGRPARSLDLLSYGSKAALGFDPERPDRRFRYDIGRRPGFVDGRPGMWWSVNGRLFPDLPAFAVAEGDVVRMRISNHSGEAHPMHLHGHHALVLARDGVPSTGSPWWVDSLDVADGESYDIAFRADNPGIWMDHCHDLPHAADGLVVHLMYEGVTTPFMVGGRAGNEPE
jgi:FtsP/CotA-like multicopper oxidase with cupredoxin domain